VARKAFAAVTILGVVSWAVLDVAVTSAVVVIAPVAASTVDVAATVGTIFADCVVVDALLVEQPASKKLIRNRPVTITLIFIFTKASNLTGTLSMESCCTRLAISPTSKFLAI
jgi:hypothetical protein